MFTTTRPRGLPPHAHPDAHARLEDQGRRSRPNFQSSAGPANINASTAANAPPSATTAPPTAPPSASATSSFNNSTWTISQMSPGPANFPAYLDPMMMSSHYTNTMQPKRSIKSSSEGLPPMPMQTTPAPPNLQQMPPQQQQQQQQQPKQSFQEMLAPPISPSNERKRRASGPASIAANAPPPMPYDAVDPNISLIDNNIKNDPTEPAPPPRPAKKSRTNTPWSPAEEQRLKTMRDAGNSWSEIAKTFPTRTEGSVKKHWYKDMHYAEFAENEACSSQPKSFSAALLSAIKEYESSKWKVIGMKVGKPAKACEQYAKEHFGNRF
ncbi:MAG: hypothetical protein M1829_000400 [Trizodia sp. TS-e1964]|nr:MAG: hypothetical protein M1829_000400 [Trizodia sp. TS-e1964]